MRGFSRISLQNSFPPIIMVIHSHLRTNIFWDNMGDWDYHLHPLCRSKSPKFLCMVIWITEALSTGVGEGALDASLGLYQTLGWKKVAGRVEADGTLFLNIFDRTKEELISYDNYQVTRIGISCSMLNPQIRPRPSLCRVEISEEGHTFSDSGSSLLKPASTIYHWLDPIKHVHGSY